MFHSLGTSDKMPHPDTGRVHLLLSFHLGDVRFQKGITILLIFRVLKILRLI